MINQWTKCEDQQPAEPGYYWLTLEDHTGQRWVRYTYWAMFEVLGRQETYWEHTNSSLKAIAWMDAPKPSPYIGGNKE